MAVRRIRAGGSLSTDASALDQPEALRTASNVLLHRDGTAQPRPGFGDTTGVAARTTDYRPIAIVPYEYGGEIVVQSYDGSTYRLEKLSANTSYGLITPEAVASRGTSDFMESRGSLYSTSSTGIQKLLVSGANTTFRRAGTWMTYQPPNYSLIDLTASSEDAARASIASDGAAAYRWLVKRTDDAGYVARSAPSSKLIVRVPSSYTTGARVELGTIYLPNEAVAGDVLELYRTRSVTPETADPGEDYYLVATYVVTSADKTNGFTDDDIWNDETANDQLGAALYTSASQFGALAAKEIPPLARCLAWWGSVAWAGHTTERRAASLWIKQVVRESGTELDGQGLCYNKNGSYTGVSGNALTGVTFSAGLGWATIAVGQWVTDGTLPGSTTGRIPVDARITAFDEGAATITLSVTPTSSGDFYAGDVVAVNGIDFTGYSSESISTGIFKIDQTSTLLTDRCYNTAISLATVISGAQAWEDGGGGSGQLATSVYALKDEVQSGGTGELFILTTHPEDVSVTLLCTPRGAAFAPDLSTTFTAPTAAKPGRIAWSAPNEPEAWPPLNSTIVGDGEAGVLALAPLDSALIVFKEDGIFRVSGNAPNSWVVDELQTAGRTPARLLAPQCVCVLDGTCYAWTDRGVIAVTEGGVNAIASAPIAAELREYQQLLPRGNADPKRGAYMVAHSRLGLIILAVPDAADDEYSAKWYVLHAASGRWSTWARTDRCAAYDPAEDRMLTSPGVDGWQALYERSDEDTAASYRDVTVTGLTGSATSTKAEIATTQFDPWTPAVGDVLYDETKAIYARVTAVDTAGGTHSLSIDSTAFSSSLTATWHQGYACTLEWQSQTLPGQGARWHEIHAALLADDSAYVSTWPLVLGGTIGGQSAAATVTATITPDSASSRRVRVGPSRDMVRAYDLYPRLAVTCAGVLWRLAEMHLHVTPQSRRVVR